MQAAALTLALSVLWPQPRQATLAPETHLRLPVRVTAAAGLSGPETLLRKELAALFGPPARGTDSTTLVRLSFAPDDLSRPEEYTVEPAPDGVLLRAHDVQGMYWAVHTLAALLGQARRVPGGYDVTIPKVRDWPDTPFRAFMIQGAWTPNPEDLKRNLELLARQHVTYVALEFGPQVVLDFDPKIAQGGRLSKAQAHEVIQYGRSLGLKPIGYLNLLGHLDRAYQKAPYTQHGGIDIRSDETYEKFVYPILSEMLEVYGPLEYFHCGMDEAWELFSWLSQQGADVKALLARHIQRINDFLKARGVKMVIWHDMFLSPDMAKEIGGYVGPANGGPPQNTAGALSMIPKDVILDYWFYDPLPVYPGLDYLQKKGFTCWASPWQKPFSFVRYARSRNAPVMGTLWTGPPDCFGSSTYSPVTAFYAQAAWNESAAPKTVIPEPDLLPAAQRATNSVLWRRRSLAFPGTEALLLTPTGARRVPWPQADVEQHYGVPLATTHPVPLPPLPDLSKPLTGGTDAATVRLPGAVTLALDGVNTGRGEDQLILYTAPLTRTGTNIYGAEVPVSADGVVLEVTGYGSGDHAIPAGGFVLSAHSGPRSDKANRLQDLRAGDKIAVLSAKGDWLGGAAPTFLLAELPAGATLRIDGEDVARGEDQLVLYQPGHDDGRTGTNQYGVEVAVAGGKVTAVRDGAGDTPIPADGYVLSAHQGPAGTKAAALRALKPGDAVRLLVERGGQRVELAAALQERRVALPVGAPCRALYLAMSTQASSSPDTPLGEWVVRYADGGQERIPVRYGREVLAASGDALPQRIGDPVWLTEQPSLRCLVCDWTNPRPDETVREVCFEPAPALLDLGARFIAATAASR